MTSFQQWSSKSRAIVRSCNDDRRTVVASAYAVCHAETIGRTWRGSVRTGRSTVRGCTKKGRLAPASKLCRLNSTRRTEAFEIKLYAKPQSENQNAKTSWARFDPSPGGLGG